MVHVMLFPVTNMLRFYISTFRSMCAVPTMAVFGSFFMSWFTIMLIKCLLIYLKIVSVAPVVTGITFVFIFHIGHISI